MRIDASATAITWLPFDALDRIREDPDLRAQLATAGRDYVLETHAWPVVRRRFREAVEALVA